MNAKRLLVSVAAGALALAIGVSPAMAQEKKPEAPKSTPTQPATPDTPKADAPKKDKDKDKAKKSDVAEIKIGDAAPAFKLKDTAGKEWNLSELTKSGKIVVLQWFNPECPYVKKHYNGDSKTFNEMATKFKDKNVVLLAVNSGPAGGPGTGVERNAEAAKKWDMNYPILIDDTQSVGKAYGSKNTPNMVVIGKDGKIAYTGAIDDNDGPDKPGKTNYVVKAVEELQAGTSVSNSKTKPYGCHITYKGDN
jgi:peroxiredoxin